MTMPSSGPLNMGGTSSPVSVAQELGLSLTATITMNDAAVRTLAGVGGSGTSWSMSSLYGKSNSYSIEYLVVAGGGGGVSAGGSGGGAGGYQAATAAVAGAYAVTIGAGGAGSTTQGSSDPAANGNNSSFIVTSTGGGAGGVRGNSGASGGSGGGAGWPLSSINLPGGAGTSGQGNNGGQSGALYNCCVTIRQGGGGGGASTAGGQLAAGTGATWLNGVTYAAGGLGRSDFPVPSSGAANSGNGGASGSGGSGIVIIRYAGAQRGTGGTVTSAGGYTYHTFTSSGTFTA